MPATNKYDSVVANLSRPLPSWVTDVDDKQRVAAYDGYDDMYKNVPGTFSVVLRGEEDAPVYVPSAAKIIEATNRYLGKGWRFTVASVNPDTQVGEGQRLEVEGQFSALFTREEFAAILFSLKRNMLKRGDAWLHITANTLNAPGTRLSINEVSARTVFRIPHPNNIEWMIGVYIVDLIFADDGKTQIARRQEYRYNETGGVDTRMTFWEPNGWDDRWVGHPALKSVETPASYREDPAMALLLAGYTLPPSITTIPLYHFRNKREGGEPYGTSQIAGVETLIAAINQTVSDEDITLALQGLGVYITDSARPVADDGQTETDWVIAPGSVLEMKAGSTFRRVEGVSTVIPFQDHLNYTENAINESTGLSSTAIGNVDVQVAASGVALRLDMAPILAQNEEKEVELLGRLDQFMFDLYTQWWPVDGLGVSEGLRITNSFSDPLPIDEDKIVDRVIKLVAAKLMSAEFAVDYLNRTLGYNFPEDMLVTIATEQDAVAERMAVEAGGGLEPTPVGE